MSGEAAAAAMEMAETAKGGNSDKGDPKDTEALDIESRILAAMRSRVTYLREKSDSFTFESVRRLLEEDLGLEKYALDVHKSFVKQHLVQCLEGADNDDASENCLETEKKEVTPVKEVAESPKERDAEKDVKEDATRDDEKMEDSPVMGLLAAEKTNKSVAEETKDEVKKEVQESEIKKALRKRAAYIKANSEKITMGLLRRLLEKDLKLEKYALDPHKKFINEQLDEVLQTPDSPKGSTLDKGKNIKKKVEKKASQKLSSKESSDSDGEDNEEVEEENVKKKTAQKRKLAKSDGPKKRKPEKETELSAKKKAKPTETDSRSGSDGADSEIVSDDGRSQSSSEKPAKPRNEAVNAAYGKRVEHLKSVIKSCGMSVPPAIYRKVKQASEDKREAALIKELEQILAKEGLSSNPSEKEIKEVKKRKERARELEGIDMSNIVSSSRRRSTTSFAPPPKPKITEESESDEEDTENEDEDEEEDEEEEDNEEGNGEAGEESQSGESNDEDDGEEQSE